MRKDRKERKQIRIPKKIFCFVTLAFLGILFYMFLLAHTVHLRYAEFSFSDLPASFDGTKILYLTDTDLFGTNGYEKAARILERTADFNPDLILLGGDYASESMFDRLLGESSTLVNEAGLFSAVSKIEAPLGRYAVSGEHDGDLEELRRIMSGNGIMLIDGTLQPVSNGTDTILLAGIGAKTSNVSSLALLCDPSQFVLTLTHTPDKILSIRVAEAGGGGAWSDITLTGHTHGGQISLNDHTPITLTETERKYRSGWYDDTLSPMLVSQGYGCEGLNLRFGTQSEIWLITLKCA